jgi:hypothetical protein
MAGAGTYVQTDGYGFNRWGDFSQTNVDPEDDQTVWTVQEYASATNVWAVRVVRVQAPPPATPASASPASICAGRSGVDVVLSGTSSAGSEFFDPGPDPGGPGFARHLTAAVSGGVVVQSATLLDPSHVALVLDTTTAAAGSQDVTVVNPDGQSASGTDLLTVMTAADTAEIGSSLRIERTEGGAVLSWDDAPGPYHVYRGLLGAGSTWSYDQSCLAAGVIDPGVTDAADPGSEELFFYLVSRVGACGESILGRDSGGVAILNAAPCSGSR